MEKSNLKPPWKPGESGNPNGAPVKTVNKLADMVQRDFGLKLTKGDKFQIIESMLEKSNEELQLIIDDTTSPVFMVSIATAIKNDISQKRINTVESIFDRVFGRPKQTQAIDPENNKLEITVRYDCLLYTSPSPRD